jgi:3-oxoacyl-[acyl-carrier protein] reductase
VAVTDQRIALVSGAAGGLGPATCERLGRDMHIVACDLDGEKVIEMADSLAERGISVEAHPLDATSQPEVDALMAGLVERLGAIDVLVNFAGVIRNAVLGRIVNEDYELTMRTHVGGTLNTMRAASNAMRAQGSGRIINMSSVAVLGSRAGGSYGAAKGAIEGLSRSAAMDLASHGITVNCVAPGVIAGGMFLTVPADYQEEVLQRVPMKRLGTPEDVAGCVAFLASEEAAYVTGQTLFVCGGLSIGF